MFQVQNVYAQSKEEIEYFELLNYTPVNYQFSFGNIIESKISTHKLNSIWKFKNSCNKIGQLTETETRWLEKEINQLALEFFLEDKPVILKEVGGYDGCPDQLLSTEVDDKRIITTIYFCRGGCISFGHTEKFIEIFNNRTNALIAKNN